MNRTADGAKGLGTALYWLNVCGTTEFHWHRQCYANGMKIIWPLMPVLLGLVVGCAAPRSDRGLAFKVDADPAKAGRERATAEAELWKFLADTGHGSKLAATAEAVKAACDAVLWNIENAGTAGFKKIMLRLKSGELERSVRSFEQGELSRTNEGLDVAILGPGFFELELPDGTKAYTRDGSFRFQPGGRLVSAKGYVLADMEPLPFRAGTIAIASDGTVKHQASDGEARSRIRVVDFANPAGLDLNSEGLFLETAVSGVAEVVRLDGSSVPARGLMQGYLEMSNVHLVEEIASLMRLMEWRRSVRGLVSVADTNTGLR